MAAFIALLIPSLFQLCASAPVLETRQAYRWGHPTDASNPPTVPALALPGLTAKSPTSQEVRPLPKVHSPPNVSVRAHTQPSSMRAWYV
ncbi:hypothetical protein ACMFMG_002637 [Clarireedia jacksonii]